jgi:DUF1680 family protein
MRTLASLGGLIATHADGALQVHQFVACDIRTDDVALSVRTAYPWHGRIQVNLDQAPAGAFALQLRRPAWAADKGLSIRVNGEAHPAVAAPNGYVSVERAWRHGDVLELELPIAPRLTEPHPRIESTRGCVAIERGPLVYCLEQADQPSLDVLDLALAVDAPIEDRDTCGELNGAVRLEARGTLTASDAWSESTFRPLASVVAPGATREVALAAVPYYAWANRVAGAMRVWIPCSQSA